MFKNITITAKFDTDGDVYLHLIETLKASKELSTFTRDLFEVYFRDQDVREIVDKYREENSPFARIERSLELIHKQHSHNSAILNNAQFTIENAKDAINDFNDEANKLPTNIDLIIEDKISQVINSRIEQLLNEKLSTLNSNLIELGDNNENSNLDYSITEDITSVDKGNDELNTYEPTMDNDIVENTVENNQSVKSVEGYKEVILTTDVHTVTLPEVQNTNVNNQIDLGESIDDVVEAPKLNAEVASLTNVKALDLAARFKSALK